MSETVRIRLRIPEGKPGDEVTVSDERAAGLVRAGYATYTEPGPAKPYEPPAYAAEGGSTAGVSSAPQVELPSYEDRKVVWVAVAETLGINVEGMTKQDVMDAVREAVDQS